MRDRVNIADTYLINRNTRMVSSNKHPLTCLEIFGVIERLLKPAEDTLHRQAPVFLAGAPIPDADVGLYAMRERVNAGRSRHRGGSPKQQIRVQRDSLRQQIIADNDVLELLGGVFNHCTHRRLATCS